MKNNQKSKNNKNQSFWLNKIINFLGYFFLILGIYALIRVSFNNVFLKEKYPLSSVFLNIPYYQTEEDCYQQFNYPLYTEKGQPREPNTYEKKLQNESIKNCLNKVKKQREENRINDIWLTLFFLILGGGIHLTKKFILNNHCHPLASDTFFALSKNTF